MSWLWLLRLGVTQGLGTDIELMWFCLEFFTSCQILKMMMLVWFNEVNGRCLETGYRPPCPIPKGLKDHYLWTPVTHGWHPGGEALGFCSRRSRLLWLLISPPSSWGSFPLRSTDSALLPQFLRSSVRHLLHLFSLFSLLSHQDEHWNRTQTPKLGIFSLSQWQM